MACTWFAQALSATQGGGGGWRLVWLGAASNTLLWLCNILLCLCNPVLFL